MRIHVLVIAAVSVFVLTGCDDTPAGLAPGQYCGRLGEIGGTPSEACVPTQRRLQQEEPEYYGCMSDCVSGSADLAAYGQCTPRCELLR